MTRVEIFEKLKEILVSADERNRALVENSTEESDLVRDFGFSSINMLYLVIAIEETFDIRFKEMGIGDLKKVGDVITYIEGEMKA